MKKVENLAPGKHFFWHFSRLQITISVFILLCRPNILLLDWPNISLIKILLSFSLPVLLFLFYCQHLHNNYQTINKSLLGLVCANQIILYSIGNRYIMAISWMGRSRHPRWSSHAEYPRVVTPENKIPVIKIIKINVILIRLSWGGEYLWKGDSLAVSLPYVAQSVLNIDHLVMIMAYNHLIEQYLRILEN